MNAQTETAAGESDRDSGRKGSTGDSSTARAPQPATPLPWEYRDATEDDSYGQTYKVSSAADRYMMADATYYNCALDKEDARYAVHAANAYPRLIAALRDALATTPPESPFLLARVTLLRELGELA